MFNVGDKVCYPMHGVGTIEAIEERTVLEATGSYYVLRFSGGRVTALVPVAAAAQVGLRKLILPEECENVIEYLCQKPEDEQSANWNKRYRENCDKLRSGDVFEVASVFRCLMLRERERGLSSVEKKMLCLSRHILLSEIAEVCGVSVESLMDRLGI